MVDTLTGNEPYTVFAPNDDAFAKLPPDTLEGLLKPENKDLLKIVLLRHVVPTTMVSGEIPKGKTTLKTAGGEQITVTNEGGVAIESSEGNATVIKLDILASNGVIHIVDSVF